jgi:Flp pilus assembly protein TadG
MKPLQPSRLTLAPAARQRGAAAVEFALVALVFFTLLLAIMEFGRWMFTLNAASEATRLGARLAVVCSLEDEALIRQRMSELTVSLSPAQMVLDYIPDKCDAGNCRTVTARVEKAEFQPLIPFLGPRFAIPPFAVSLPRESMNSSQNRVCPSHPDHP